MNFRHRVEDLRWNCPEILYSQDFLSVSEDGVKQSGGLGSFSWQVRLKIYYSLKVLYNSFWSYSSPHPSPSRFSLPPYLPNFMFSVSVPPSPVSLCLSLFVSLSLCVSVCLSCTLPSGLCWQTAPGLGPAYPGMWQIGDSFGENCLPVSQQHPNVNCSSVRDNFVSTYPPPFWDSCPAWASVGIS